MTDRIIEIWEKEFDPAKNPPMPVTLYEDFNQLIQERVIEARFNELVELQFTDRLDDDTKDTIYKLYLESRLKKLSKEQP